jgi:hypothetical protein
MALIDQVAAVCARLAPLGWGKLLLAHKVDITVSPASALAKELLKVHPPEDIRRDLRGFEDFARDGRRAIEPGAPAQSLLYHALAAPDVLTDPDGLPLVDFPTPAEIEAVENYVFAAARRTLQDVVELAETDGRPPSKTKRTKAAPAPAPEPAPPTLAVVVFACEYRPASQTCHKFHADLVFSRMGVARVGTAPPLYQRKRRGFLPEDEGDPFAIRVLPARYAAYLAVKKPGDEEAFRPARFQSEPPDDGDTDFKPDDQHDFWVPVHKLFPGDECLRDKDFKGLKVTYSAGHVNEKIRRVHLALGGKDVPTTPPYVITRGIAKLSTDPDFGTGMVVPVHHPRLVEPAVDETSKAPVTYDVPPNPNKNPRYSSFAPPQGKRGLRAPEFVHARTMVTFRQDGSFSESDLNLDADHPDVKARVGAGGYKALHYVDFSGDGWVTVDCPQLAGREGIEKAPRAAYSLVTAPDFFPTCDQRELTEWTASSAVPDALKDELWGVPPATLCDQRLPANLQMPGATFDPSEDGIPALVPLLRPAPVERTVPVPADALRHSHLPDDAAGVFDPGWDVTWDDLTPDAPKSTPHLAAYGLGSPFPEDVKLCAALGSFWPAVAPDSARTTEPNPNPRLSRTVIPLTDAEIGREGQLAWDGVAGPRVVEVDGQEIADYPSFQHVDYIRNALDGRFTMRLTARVNPDEYQNRVLAMAMVYRALRVSGDATGGDPLSWIVLSFRSVVRGDPELDQAEIDARVVLHGDVYRFELFERVQTNDPINVYRSPHDFRRRWVPVANKRLFFAEPADLRVLYRPADQVRWRRVELGL